MNQRRGYVNVVYSFRRRFIAYIEDLPPGVMPGGVHITYYRYGPEGPGQRIGGITETLRKYAVNDARERLGRLERGVERLK